MDASFFQLLELAWEKSGLDKSAFVDPQTASMGAGMPQGGMPPGAAPMPGGMPMDPMAAGGGMPMDPMQGGMPMDPMQGGMPMDPMAAGGEAASEPAAGGGESSSSTGDDAIKNLLMELKEIKQLLANPQAAAKPASGTKSKGGDAELYMKQMVRMQAKLMGALGVEISPEDMLQDEEDDESGQSEAKPEATPKNAIQPPEPLQAASPILQQAQQQQAAQKTAGYDGVAVDPLSLRNSAASHGYARNGIADRIRSRRGD